MGRATLICVGLTALLGAPPPRGSGETDHPDGVTALCRAFQDYSGANLVFEARDLPPGKYHDRMPSLSPARRLQAAKILLAEVRKLPPGYLGALGLKVVGAFDRCVSARGDGFRPYDAAAGGYRYYGIWNGENAVACAYYSDGQLPLTFHHEVFHHVDATEAGRTDADRLRRDERFGAAVGGTARYPAPAVPAVDLAALESRARGELLEGAVGRYADKNQAEDKAETARYLMSHLPDALTQVVRRPGLAGSQRLLHVLAKYQQAVAGGGPDFNWFVGAALGRAPASRPETARDNDPGAERATPGLRRPKRLPLAEPEFSAARLALYKAGRATGAKPVAAEDLRTAATVLEALMAGRICPHPAEGFVIHGAEDREGINWTLRADLTAFAVDAQAVAAMAGRARGGRDLVAPAVRHNLRMLARYYVFIDNRWAVTPATRERFESARDALLEVLPGASAEEICRTTAGRWERLAAPDEAGVAPDLKPAPDNPYSRKVDEAVANPVVRAALRRAQAACVRLGNGSGVNLTPDGCVLTNAHVAKKLGAKLTAQFPDGRSFDAFCTAIDAKLDLALLRLNANSPLPAAPLAAAAPVVGTRVICIGQPGNHRPGGEATGYQPFHVSAGTIRGVSDDPLGPQMLGRTKHDAWTYWGHSGSPLFEYTGGIVALHNSWDSTTAMRHAVSFQAILSFLDREKVKYARLVTQPGDPKG